MAEVDNVWILDSGSSRYLVVDESVLEDVKPCADVCVQMRGPLNVTKKGTVMPRVTTRGKSKLVRLTEVYYAAGVVHSLISYGKLDDKGCTLSYKGGKRVMVERSKGAVDFDAQLYRNVLVVRGKIEKTLERSSDVIMATLGQATRDGDEMGSNVQNGSLLDFHKRFVHLNYDAVVRLARKASPGVELTDHRRTNCLTCAQGKQ